MSDFGWLAPQVARLPSERATALAQCISEWIRTSGAEVLPRGAYIRAVTSEAATGRALDCDS